MPRPSSDLDAGRAHLLDLVEELIRKRGAASVTLTELAAEAGMSPANIYRFFQNKEALYEAVAERWFAPKLRIMEEVIESDASARDKLIAFFGRRFALMRDNFLAEPKLFLAYIELGNEHEEQVQGYLDLGDHYLAMIVAQAMDEGHFEGLSVDHMVSLLNISFNLFINPRMIAILEGRLTEQKLAQLVDALLVGLRESGESKTAPKLVAV